MRSFLCKLTRPKSNYVRRLSSARRSTNSLQSSRITRPLTKHNTRLTIVNPLASNTHRFHQHKRKFSSSSSDDGDPEYQTVSGLLQCIGTVAGVIYGCYRDFDTKEIVIVSAMGAIIGFIVGRTYLAIKQSWPILVFVACAIGVKKTFD